MKRLFFVGLALMVLLVTPVCAWIELQTDVLDITDESAHGAAGYNYIRVANCSAFSRDVTRLHMEVQDTLLAAGGTTNGSESSVITKGDGDGNATIIWSTTGTFGEWGIATIDIYITDLVDSPTNTTCDLGFTTPFRNSGSGNYFKHHTGVPTSTYSYSLTNSDNPPAGTYIAYGGSEVITPVSSFTCTPTSQFPDADVVCTDTSTGGELDYYWTLDAETWGTDAWMTDTQRNFTWQSHYPGIFSVNLRATNGAGSDWENKSSYVSISNNATPNNCNLPVQAGYIRSMAQCVDSQTSGAIDGCDLQLHDLEGGAWSNITDRFDGTWCIDTLPGHHINAYGQADGYSSAARVNLPASDTVMYELIMVPGYLPTPADGKVWLFILVNDADTGAALSEAYVRVMASGLPDKSDVTGANGVYSLQWYNATTTYITASKTGYGTKTKTLTTSDFGPDTIRIELQRGIITPTATSTTGPGGTVPTTIGPGGSQTPGGSGTMPPVGSVKYTNFRGQQMMDLLAYYGFDLVMLCILVTILALLGIKLGK